jgi:Tetratricopeptide repeat
MKSIRWLSALLGLCLGVGEMQAQIVIVQNPYSVGGFSTISGGGISYTRYRHHGGLSLSFGSVSTSGFYGAGPFGYPGYSSITVVYGSPRYLFPAPLVLNPFPPDVFPIDPPRREVFEPGLRERERLAEQGNNRPRVGRLPAPEQGRMPDKPMPLPDPPPAKPEPPAKPPEPPMPPMPPAPEKDPIAENERLLKQGREAFAAREYGRAVQRFRQATRIAPQRAQAHFLLAQALLALGKYHEAVDAIDAGVALNPNWPNERFQPLQMYGANVADYPDHLRRLEDTLTANPGDPVLLFLTGYQLWFDGRRDESRRLFQRALPGAANQEVIQRFLRAMPGAPVL